MSVASQDRVHSFLYLLGTIIPQGSSHNLTAAYLQVKSPNLQNNLFGPPLYFTSLHWLIHHALGFSSTPWNKCFLEQINLLLLQAFRVLPSLVLIILRQLPAADVKCILRFHQKHDFSQGETSSDLSVTLSLLYSLNIIFSVPRTGHHSR